jgi:hypothetical protein
MFRKAVTIKNSSFCCHRKEPLEKYSIVVYHIEKEAACDG